MLDLAFSPLTWAMALVITGLAIAGRAPARKWLCRGCLTLAVGVLYLFSIQRVSNALERYLEAGARSTIKEGVVYDGVVLLGGIVDVLVSEPDRPRAYGQNSERLLATYDLLRTGLAKEVVVSSGDGLFTREAHVLRQQLIDWGIAPERTVIDDQSRNTRENAVESARVARERGWKSILVVTSAYHMERALGCFKAVGLEVDALPVDPRAYDPVRFSGSWLPRVGNLAQSTHALHEMAGRVIYRVRGYAQ
jgi:uncharacterized SAM-binding protein YcdF (DUF218 family)